MTKINQKDFKNLHTDENIVEKYKIGNTTIKICDDAYKDKQEEDVEKILKRCADIFYKYILNGLNRLNGGNL